MSQKKKPRSENAVKHGIGANVQTRYDVVDFEDIVAQMTVEFVPSSYTATLLVEQLAITYLRITRCERFEADIIREAINPPTYSESILEVFNPSERRVISENDKAPLTDQTLEKFRLLYERYEPRLFSRFCKLLEMVRSYSNVG